MTLYLPPRLYGFSQPCFLAARPYCLDQMPDHRCRRVCESLQSSRADKQQGEWCVSPTPGKLFTTCRRTCLQGDEWEEKWGEWWASLGRANKWADKWGKDGGSVWHEKWGEDYDGEGGCIKYTDRVRQGRC